MRQLVTAHLRPGSRELSTAFHSVWRPAHGWLPCSGLVFPLQSSLSLETQSQTTHRGISAEIPDPADNEDEPSRVNCLCAARLWCDGKMLGLSGLPHKPYLRKKPNTSQLKDILQASLPLSTLPRLSKTKQNKNLKKCRSWKKKVHRQMTTNRSVGPWIKSGY